MVTDPGMPTVNRNFSLPPMNGFARLTSPPGQTERLYLVDLYRGVLQHRAFLLRPICESNRPERGLDKPIHRGRIFHASRRKVKLTPWNGRISLRKLPLQWVSHLSHSNSWWRYTAQRLLVEKRDEATIRVLKTLALGGANPLGRMHALWTLDGMKALELPLLEPALKDPSPLVRAAAIRLCEPFFHSEEKQEAVDALLKLKSDPAPEVQQQLALTLGETRTPQTDLILANLGNTSVPSPFIASAIESGLHGREFYVIEHLLAEPAWQEAECPSQNVATRFVRLRHQRGRISTQVESLITLAAKKSIRNSGKFFWMGWSRPPRGQAKSR